MKHFMILAVVFMLASRAFAIGPQTPMILHGESGYDHKSMAVAVVLGPPEGGRLWLNTDDFSYPLLYSERDTLLGFLKTAAKKIDIAVSNKTTFSYEQEVGRFATDNSALITVSFETRGHELSYTVVQIMNGGNNVIILLNQKDTQDFIDVLENTLGVLEDYQRQVALFK